MFFNIPSIYSHIINGILLIVISIIIVVNLVKISHFGLYNILVILLLFNIAMGIHSISHLGLEKTYNYNPYKLFF